MPQTRTREKVQIPSTILRSDRHAQSLWKKAHDSAVRTYGDSGRAHRVAYAALKHEYEKKGDHWVNKGWKGPSDPQAAQSVRDKPKATARGKIASSESEARQKARLASKEYAQEYRARKKTIRKKSSAKR